MVIDISSYKAKMFNRRAADPISMPDEILASLNLQKEQRVLDIGAGGGYYSLRFAAAVGSEGQVYAADTNEGFLEFIGVSAREKGLNNIELIKVTEARLPISDKSIDLIFMRKVYHHLKNRVEYCRRLLDTLKPRGMLAVIEYRKSTKRLSFRRLFGHYVESEIIIQEMEEAGYQLIKQFDFLPRHSFILFSPKA